MNADPRDDLDRAIDETLASFAAAEPRRVSKASVREALGKNRHSRLPVWLALAAALILGVMNRREILPVQNPAKVATTGPVDLAPAPTPATSPAGKRETRVGDVSHARRGERTRVVRAAGVPAPESPRYEGLPRLTIAPIDSAPATTLAGLDTDAIEMTGLEVAPLVVPSLSPEPLNR